MQTVDNGILKNLKYDLPASLVVFLVALPLCLGIALASGADPLSGLIAGISGGIIAGMFSGSQLAVSGPAAGLTIIVLDSINSLDNYFPAFLVAVVLAGLIQLLMGYLKAGIIGNFFPISVIKGMLSAIGLTLILKQIPHAVGWDKDFEGEMSFVQPDGQNTFSELFQALNHISLGAVIICIISLALLIVWERPALKKYTLFKLVPAPLLVVILGIGINSFFGSSQPDLVLSKEHLVSIPSFTGLTDFADKMFTFPDFSFIGNSAIWVTAITIAVVASLETLLSIEATDKMDPYKRSTPLNRELKAQGLGNMVSGLLGGLPITAVIVRSTANINAGGRTKVSAVVHGFLLLGTVALIPNLLSKIPFSSLAAILFIVGYKLSKPELYKEMYRKGLDQFIPFIVTIAAILLTDLLIGIGIGMVVGFFFVLRTNYHTAIQVTTEGNKHTLKLEKDVSFLNKAAIRQTIDGMPKGALVVIDGSQAEFIDSDVIEMLEEYHENAETMGLDVKLVGIDSKAAPAIKVTKNISAQVSPAREAKRSDRTQG